MATERDPALLPGPTAAQWNGRARLLLAGGVGALVLGLLLLAFWKEMPAPVLVAVGVLAAAGLIGWIVVGGIGQRRMREELDAGYSTVVDAAGYAFRHPVTGTLERDHSVEPAAPGPRSFLLDNLRIRQDTWVDRQRGRDED